MLAEVESYLKTAIAPQGIVLDQDPSALWRALRGLGDRGWLALRVPVAAGGGGLDGWQYWQFQAAIARYSGALAFLQTQHQSAAALLAQSPNDRLKETYLPLIPSGQRLLGIGFSHLRHPEPPLKAIAVEGGYEFTGSVPWATGYGCFHDWLVAAVLPSGDSVFGLIPFRELRSSTGGEMTFQGPMLLTALQSTQTVSASLRQWFVPAARVVCHQPGDWIHENDRRNALKGTSLALGCAQAGIDQVVKMAQRRDEAALASVAEALGQERDRCCQAIRVALETGSSPWEDQLRLRAWATELAFRCAQAGVVAAGGAANQRSHDAQRIYREAIVFSVSGQTAAIREATLQRLTQAGDAAL